MKFRSGLKYHLGPKCEILLYFLIFTLGDSLSATPRKLGAFGGFHQLDATALVRAGKWKACISRLGRRLELPCG
jgi:hypothetical protein